MASPTWQGSVSPLLVKGRCLALICSPYILPDRVTRYLASAPSVIESEHANSSICIYKRRKSEDIGKKDNASNRDLQCRRNKARPPISISLWLSVRVPFTVLMDYSGTPE
jgi:hypothetical protein